jgi:NAD(P)H dehydrogenase (quinone)
MLWPVNFTLAYVGYTVLTPFIAYGVEAGIRYSNPGVVEKRLRAIEEDLAARLTKLDDVPSVPFNRMCEWGEDGRVNRSAPAYSPFIRHKRELELE